jgi:AraC-like DNA-binding protein
MAMRRKVIAGATAAVLVGGAGAGVAAPKLARPSPREESKAIVEDAAKNLGVSPSRLTEAIKKAFSDRIDAAVAAGRLTKAQGEELKQRLDSGDFPLFGPPAFGPGFPGPQLFFHGLGSAASYLGLTEAQLHNQLEQGKTLAEIAKAQHKSVDGLKAALLDDVKAKLDAAVKDGRLTKAREQLVLKDFQARIDDLVTGQLRERFREHKGFGFGFRHFRGGFDRQGPPPAPFDTAA